MARKCTDDPGYEGVNGRPRSAIRTRIASSGPMSEAVFYGVLADAILVLHLLLAGFVVLGFVLIVIGIRAGWLWICNRTFRTTHLVVIGIIVIQAWLGRLCPLTLWENQLREKAGQSGYPETFIQYWVQKILFYQAEPWVFAVVYTLFGAGVLVCWVIAKPGRDG